jgi:predicted nuclease of predicted toxin-antitoxin system
MAIAFYMDQHVPLAITEGLRQRGVDVLRVQDDGHDRADDDVILDRAGTLGRVVFTLDRDFLAEAHRRQLSGTPFVGVVYAPQLGPTIGQCVRDLELIAGVYDLAEMANRVEYLPL